VQGCRPVTSGLRHQDGSNVQVVRHVGDAMIRALNTNYSVAVTSVTLTDDDVSHFVRDGVVQLRDAFSREVADDCRQLLWEATGCDERDQSTWTRPVIRVGGRADLPFAAAINTERLRSAFDQLAGIGRWIPRTSIGTFPIRFPVDEAPGDDGWHIEATGTDTNGNPIVDANSKERILFLLFLFSDVGPDDAPTRVRLGSHFHGARLLFNQSRPIDFFEAARELDSQTKHLPETAATGEAGDVWLCHPFVVHAAQRHRGNRVKFMGQPPLGGYGVIDPNRASGDRSPVEDAVHQALSH